MKATITSGDVTSCTPFENGNGLELVGTVHITIGKKNFVFNWERVITLHDIRVADMIIEGEEI